MHYDTGNSGQAKADKIKFSLENLSLDLNIFMAWTGKEGCDGPGNMSANYQGATAIAQHWNCMSIVQLKT